MSMNSSMAGESIAIALSTYCTRLAREELPSPNLRFDRPTSIFMTSYSLIIVILIFFRLFTLETQPPPLERGNKPIAKSFSTHNPFTMTFALGVAAALVAPFSMVMGFLIWDNTWTGSPFALNLYKCNLAALGFAIVVGLSWNHHHDNHLDNDRVFTVESVGFLMLSSTIGLLLGDWAWLEGMRVVGARKVIVVDALKPFFAALVAHWFLNESMPTLGFLGLVLTATGVALVGLEQERSQHSSDQPSESYDNPQEILSEKGPSEIDALLGSDDDAANELGSKSYAKQRSQRKQSISEICYGLLIAFLNVVFHTFGALITKLHGARMTSWEICLIRFGFAGIVMLIMSLVLQARDAISRILQSSPPTETKKPTLPAESRRWYHLPSSSISTWLTVSLGVAFLGFLQPALTNYALFEISLALLLTLESVGPLYSIPMAYWMQREIPTFRAIAGAFLAVAGIVVLSIWGEGDDDI